MNNRFVRYGAITAMAVAALFCVSIPAAAQQAGYNAPAQQAVPNPAAEAASRAAALKEAAAKPTSRTADGHPDLNGYWGIPAAEDDRSGVRLDAGPGGLVRAPAEVSPDGKTIRLGFLDYGNSEERERRNTEVGLKNAQAAVAEGRRPSYKPQYQAKVDELMKKSALLDPGIQCQPFGVPRMGPPTEIVHTPTAVYFLYTVGLRSMTTYRVIPVDGRQHDNNVDFMSMGDSIGHWEGDTLVVDVTRLSPDTWLNGNGDFHDENLRVVERLTRKGNTILYTQTVEDPTLFTKPWTPPSNTLMLTPGEHAREDYPCIERSIQHHVNEYRINTDDRRLETPRSE